MQQFQEIMYTNSLWTILSIISIVQCHYINFTFCLLNNFEENYPQLT